MLTFHGLNKRVERLDVPDTVRAKTYTTLVNPFKTPDHQRDEGTLWAEAHRKTVRWKPAVV